jgi:hypothetical protein
MLSCPARERSTWQNHSGDKFVVPTPSAALRGRRFENRKGWGRLFRGDLCSKARQDCGFASHLREKSLRLVGLNA